MENSAKRLIVLSVVLCAGCGKLVNQAQTPPQANASPTTLTTTPTNAIVENEAGAQETSNSEAKPQKGASTKPTTASTPAPDNAWPMVRGNSQSTGVSSATLPDKLELLWKYEGAGEAGYEATATIVDGVVYIPDLYGTLHALNLDDGKPIWTFLAGEVSGFVGSPAVADGQVFVGDIDGIVYGLDAKTGKKIWEFETDAEIGAAPNIYQDSILIGSQDAILYRLKRSNGELVWKHPIDDQIRCTPTIVENRAFVGGCDARLHVIDIDKGEAISSVELESRTGVTPAVEGDYAYLGTEGGLFLAIHWRDAEVAWTHEDDTNVQPIHSCPAVKDGLVIYGGRDKRLRALDVKNGEERWSFAAKGPIEGSPVIVGNYVYFGAEDGRLYRVDLKTGKSDWQRQLAGKLKASSPAVADGRLVIATDHGVVYCLGEKK